MKNLFLKSAGVVLCMSLLASANTVYCASNYSFDKATSNTNYSTLQGKVVYVPVGTTASAVLSQEINSQTCSKGTNVYATLDKNFVYEGITVAPAGSMLNGTVVDCQKAGLGNRNGQVEIRFTSIRTPQGYNIPVSAMILTTDGSGVLKGGATKDSAKDYGKNVAIGAAGGAVLGTALGPLSGGKVGKGAIYGTAVGGGLGLLNAARQSGESVTIPANAAVEIYFDQPITLSAPSGY